MYGYKTKCSVLSSPHPKPVFFFPLLKYIRTLNNKFKSNIAGWLISTIIREPVSSTDLLVHFLLVFCYFVNEGVVSAVQQFAEITLDWQGELADALNYQVESLSTNRSRRLDGESVSRIKFMQKVIPNITFKLR